MLLCVAVISALVKKKINSVKLPANFSMSSVLPTVFFVLGGPGAGKGTQCLNLVKEYKFVHLSAGDLLRAERASGSNDGNLIETYIREGQIVPVEITIRLLEKAMTDSPTKLFLIDGFPRNEDNLIGWTNRMQDRCILKGVLYFDCPEEVCVQRIMERGKTSGRTDDNEESLRKRFRTFYNETLPIIHYYENKGLVMNFKADSSPDIVFEDVKCCMNKLL
ncbi:UMP-CMP kinase isoform X1 [Hydra vulgaris]|nr:UMP-CMP kinase isoform X1 [Hydra vulgaris]